MGTILNIVQNIFAFFNSYEGNATLLVLIVLLFKLYINRKATAIDHKRMFVSIPAEVTFLVLGFLLSEMVSSTNGQGDNFLTGILLSLLVLIVQIAVEKYIDDKLSGRLGVGWILLITFMYILSIILYVYALFGGGVNG